MRWSAPKYAGSCAHHLRKSGLTDPADQHHRPPPAQQVALLVPLVAGLLGLLNSFRMTRLTEPKPSGAADMILGG